MTPSLQSRRPPPPSITTTTNITTVTNIITSITTTLLATPTPIPPTRPTPLSKRVADSNRNGAVVGAACPYGSGGAEGGHVQKRDGAARKGDTTRATTDFPTWLLLTLPRHY